MSADVEAPKTEAPEPKAPRTKAEDLEVKLKDVSHVNLRLIYEQQMEFARLHNGFVWQVSSIFIPFSLAGLALDIKTEEQLQFVGYGSIAVIVMWVVFSEWHRWIWVHSFFIAGVIEKILEIRDNLPDQPNIFNLRPPELVGVSIAPPYDFGRIARLFFSISGIIVWSRRICIGIEERVVAACCSQ